MGPRDWFALGVRLFGIWLIARGMTYVASFADLKLYPVSDKARDSASAHLIYAMLDFGLAALFLLGTRTIVDWSYGEEPGGTADPQETSEPPGAGHRA